MERKRLHGKISSGMFPNERIVVVDDYQGRKFSLMIPDYAVEPSNESEGQIEVRLVETKNDLALIQLPGEVFGTTRTITVYNEQLRT